ncbi:hypothetical protein V1291_003726 [Nitrobacteraceae bacterium AZCC 1564]
MRKSLLAIAAVLVAAPAAVTISSTPASAGLFCATYSDGGSYRSCNYPTYASCTRSIRGAGGICVANPNFAGYGAFEDSYAYAPGPAYGPTYYEPYESYESGPGYYTRPGVDIYIGGSID